MTCGTNSMSVCEGNWKSGRCSVDNPDCPETCPFKVAAEQELKRAADKQPTATH